jgi:heat shock protein HslJ
MMERRLGYFSLAALLVGVGTVLASAADEIEGRTWVLGSYRVAGATVKVAQGLDQAPLAGSRVDIRFENGRVTGTSGCNSYGGSYVLDGTALAFGPMISTRKACPQDLMKQEGDYLRVLGAADTVALDANGLTLSGPAGAARFAAEVDTLTGVWTVVGYNNGKAAVVSVKVGTEITATFGTDGRLSGSAGCNTYSGAYQVNGTEIAIGQVAATQKMCLDADVMSQEQLFLGAIQAGTKVELRGDTLGLRDAKGATQVTCKRRTAPAVPPARR